MAKGRITRKDLVDDKVFQIGPDYAKSVQKAIEANAVWKKSFDGIIQAALEFNKIESEYKLNPDRQKFIDIKEREVKARTSGTDAVKNEQDALIKLQKVEQAIIDTERKRLQLSKQKESASKRSVKLTQAERLERQRLNKTEKEEAILKSRTSSLIDKLNVKRERSARIVQDLVAKRELGNKLSKQEEASLNRSTAAFNKYDRAIKMAKETTNRFQESVGKYPKQFAAASGGLRKLISAFGLTSGIFLFAGAVRNAVNVFVDFDQAQADTAAILGKTRSQITKLTEDAKRLGASTAFTATQVSALQLELSKLGFNEDEILKATEGVEQFAIATGVEAARAAKLAGSAIRGFGLDASEAGRVASVLAVATTKSAASFETLEVAMPKVSAVARAFGFSIEDTTALLSSLQNAGLEASVAGTSLRSILLNLADSNGKLAKKLGGGAKNLDELVKSLIKARDGGVDLAEALELTDKRSVAAFQVFLQGAEDVEVLRDSLIGVEDELDALAEQKLNSVRGELTLLNSAWQGWILSLDESDGAAKSIRETIQLLTKNLVRILDTTVKLIKAFAIYKAIMISINVVTRAYGATVVLLRAYKLALAGGITKARAAMIAFNTATKANPIGLLLSVLAGGIATWLAFRDGVEEVTEAMIAMNEEVEKSAQASRDRIQDNIQAINDQLNIIDVTVDNERVATDKKVKLLDEEITKREEAYDAEVLQAEQSLSNSDALIEANADRVKSEVQTSKKIIQERKSLNDVLDSFEESGGVSSFTSSGGSGPTGPSSAPGPVNVGAFEGQEEAEKLKKIRQDLIFALAKIDRQGAKRRKDDTKKAAFELQKFILENQIKFLDELANDENNELETRLNSIEARGDIEVALAEHVARNKFEASKRFSQAEIEQIIETGKITIDQRKKINDQELLVIAQLNAKKKEIQEGTETDSVDVEVDTLKKQAKAEEAIIKKKLATELQLENENFKSTLALYDTEKDALEAHEERKLEIKRRYAIEGLNVQIDALEQLVKAGGVSFEQQALNEQKLAELKQKVSDITTATFIESNNKKLENDREATAEQIKNLEGILDVSYEIAEAITELANAIFEAKIQRIDEEIEREDEKFARALENEHLSDTQKKKLEDKREATRKKLEDKKRKEQRKQAIFNKALAIVDIGIQTALAIIKSVAASPQTGGLPFSAISAALGAIQIAAVIATPIPKYATGTDNHPGGPAEVGEVRPEVITEPGKKPYIVKNRTVLNLPPRTTVAPSLEEYYGMMRSASSGIIQSRNKRLTDFQNSTGYNDNTDIIKAMRENTEAVKRNKPKAQRKEESSSDIPHELFRYKNINWDD